jgi:hypothetical protein
MELDVDIKICEAQDITTYLLTDLQHKYYWNNELTVRMNMRK